MTVKDWFASTGIAILTIGGLMLHFDNKADDRMARIEDGLTDLSTKMTGVSERIAHIEGMGIGKQLDGIGTRLGTVSNDLKGISARIAGIDTKVALMESRPGRLAPGL